MENQTMVNTVKVTIKNTLIEEYKSGDIEFNCCLIIFNGASLNKVKSKNKKPILIINTKNVITEPVA